MHARSKQEPALLVFDDLYWIDPASDDWVAELVEAVDGTRTLVLLNFRPEYGAPWMQRAHYQQLPLTPLGAEETRALARDLLGPDPSVAGLPDTIAARTGGNPFFTEEVVLALGKSGHLGGTPGAYRLATPIAQIDVPTNVQATPSARIDRLGEREKHVLQTAAVIGKEFPDAILREIVELPDEDLTQALSALRAAEFLYERALYPTLEYAFKHPLTQEVAYQSQLGQRRKPVHAAVARALEAREPGRADENAALLAYHWDEADDVERAAQCHERARGQRPRTHPDVARAGGRGPGRRGPDRLGDRELGATTRWVVANANYFLGNLERCEETCREAIEICEGDPDFGAEAFGGSPYIQALGMRGGVRVLQGRAGEAARDLEQLYASLGDGDPASTRAYTFHVMRCFGVYLHLLLDDGPSALAETRQALQGLEGRGNPAADHFMRHSLGIAQALNGEWAEGMATCEDTLRSMREKNTFLQMEAETLVWIARCRLELGDLEGVRAALAEARAAAERIGTRMHLPHLHLVEARLALRSGADDAEIESALGASLEAARAMGADAHAARVDAELAASA